MRLSTGVLKVAVAVVALGILAACGAPPRPQELAPPEQVYVIVTEAPPPENIALSVSLESAEIWYQVLGKPGEVKWTLVFSAGAAPWFDAVSIHVKPESPNQDVFPPEFLLTKQTVSGSSGTPIKAPDWKSPNWDYSVTALKGGRPVLGAKALDPRIIIRK